MNPLIFFYPGISFNMQLWDYHTHNKLCNHATGTMEDYVQSAISKGLSEIGLSDHFPMEFLPKESGVHAYSMAMDKFPEYIAECEWLRQKYSDQIQVRISTELDFYPEALIDLQTAIAPYLARLDYILGSVHVIKVDHSAPFGVDDRAALDVIEEFGQNRVYRAYYSSMIEMVNTGLYDIIAHCDLPKKFGVYLGNDEDVWQYKVAFLDAVKRAGMTIEINHAGFSKPIGIQYPGDRMLKAIVERGIPLVFSSDSHSPDQIGQYFEKTYQKLKDLERETGKKIFLAKYERRKKKLIPLE